MAIYTNLPVYRATYAFMVCFSSMMPDMPRDCRYTLGQDVRRKIMDVIVLIYRANRTRRKIQMIAQMREIVLEIQVYVRLMNDLRFLSEKRYLDLAEQMAAISKQLVAWEKSEWSKVSGEQNDRSE